MVVDDDRHAEQLGDLLSDDARSDIGRTAGGDGNDQPDRSRWILGERRGARQDEEARSQKVTKAKTISRSLLIFSHIMRNCNMPPKS